MNTTAKLNFKSLASEAIHASATALFSVGAINPATMREYDESCLKALPPIAPNQIKKIRQSLKVSQPVFARYLNTSESTI